MKTKLRPTRHGKWSHKKRDSLEKKMMLVRELFALNGTELNHGNHIPDVVFIKFYGNERRFSLCADGRCRVYINEKYIRSSDLDYIILCALCFYYTERRPDLILGGKLTLVDLHASIDNTDSVVRDVVTTVSKNVAAIVLTRLIVSAIS